MIVYITTLAISEAMYSNYLLASVLLKSIRLDGITGLYAPGPRIMLLSNDLVFENLLALDANPPVPLYIIHAKTIYATLYTM